MNRLLLLRHAKAVPLQGDGEDRGRALAPSGEEAARVVAGWMAERGLRPDLVLCSSALRTRLTLARMLPLLGAAPELLYEDGLYLAGAPGLLARLRKIAPERASVLLVGHNPGLHELAVMLGAAARGKRARRLRENLPTAALAGFEIAGAWAALEPEGARLAWFVTPKEIARAGA
jgi:phosphohistidine phosphatase